MKLTMISEQQEFRLTAEESDKIDWPYLTQHTMRVLSGHIVVSRYHKGDGTLSDWDLATANLAGKAHWASGRRASIASCGTVAMQDLPVQIRERVQALLNELSA